MGQPPDFSELSDAQLHALFDNEYSFVKSTVDSLPSDFETGQRRQISELVFRNEAVFSRNEFHLGLTNFFRHRLNTGDALPIAQPLRRHAKAHLEVIDQTVQKLVDAEVVEPACSPWAIKFQCCIGKAKRF